MIGGNWRILGDNSRKSSDGWRKLGDASRKSNDNLRKLGDTWEETWRV